MIAPRRSRVTRAGFIFIGVLHAKRGRRSRGPRRPLIAARYLCPPICLHSFTGPFVALRTHSE